ncbi:leucine-rich repeat domain-containing protein [Chryseobacterium gleum]|uniref:leucine-rich repeat domain-containing protein n=1 Tax=Chryseobacterium gleum TaxID=250 RepID=UPI001E3AE6DE|nr:leucine-rich repeat domain-containing protein [Chryseobacterium gleum]MCD9618174.1 leucine-rich repeat domain-containing protein [Chryseobacterium gleum]
MKTKEELKKYFENGDIPVQEDFWALMDSYWHKNEKISEGAIENYEKVVPFFNDNGLLSSAVILTIPVATNKIHDSAFVYTGMSYQIIKVILNEGLEEIGYSAFLGQNIKSIKTPSTLKIIRDQAFWDQKNNINGPDSLEEIILNEGLTTIGAQAFYCPRATVIKDLYIPDSVKSVGQNAFAIPSLKTVSVPFGLDLSNTGIPSTATITYR